MLYAKRPTFYTPLDALVKRGFPTRPASRTADIRHTIICPSLSCSISYHAWSISSTALNAKSNVCLASVTAFVYSLHLSSKLDSREETDALAAS